MERLVFDIHDQRFLSDPTDDCAFCVLVGSDALSYMIADAQGHVRAIKHWVYQAKRPSDVENAVRVILGGDPAFNARFRTTHCAFFNQWTTLVPYRMFSAAQLPVYFHLMQPDTPLLYGSQDLPESECHLVYGAPAELMRLTQMYFPAQTPLHSAGPLLQAYTRAAQRNGADVFLHLRHQYLQIAVYERQKLIFYNSFPFSKASDILYFTLLAYDQNRLNPLSFPLTVSGDLVEDADIHRLLQRYIKHIRWMDAPASLSLKGLGEATPRHLFFDLFSLYSF